MRLREANIQKKDGDSRLMTAVREISVESKKKQNLRNNEYYNTQKIVDELYESSKNGHKFYDLISNITSRENILLAYRNIKKNIGSNTKGVNNTTIKDIARWEVEKLVEYVKNRLENYIPLPVRRIYIPKPDGRKRPLGIPTIEDRFIQQCIKQILEPICEAKFYPHSYGFRPNRSTKHAIARSLYLVNITKLHFTVDIDIRSFFDEVNHGKLLKQLWSLGIRDKNLLSILSKLLKSEIDKEGIPDKGTPQGGIISPLLANVVLNELDWWLSDQWQTFETDYNYSRKDYKYSVLRKSHLKEVYTVRYADDLKIFCRDYETASKIKIAVSKWLKERLKLEVSKKKTRITNLKTSYSNFLGIKFKVVKKGNKYVCKSRISDNTKGELVYKLKEQISKIKKETTVEQVSKLNAKILGMHNYYNMASLISQDFNDIAFQTNRILENRLRTNLSEKGYKSKAYQKFYGKYNYKPYCVAGIRIFPIAGVCNSPPMNFSQDICDYTKEGRKKIHDKLKCISTSVLQYLVRNPVKEETVEYNDNRISRYSGQKGCCYITDKPLKIGKLECHHKKPRNLGRDDSYRNLILVTKDIHKLIHARDRDTIEKYIRKIDKVNFDETTLSKLNKFRSKAGNDCIKLT